MYPADGADGIALPVGQAIAIHAMFVLEMTDDR